MPHIYETWLKVVAQLLQIQIQFTFIEVLGKRNPIKKTKKKKGFGEKKCCNSLITKHLCSSQFHSY